MEFTSSCALSISPEVQIGSMESKAPLVITTFFPSILHTTVISFLSESKGSSVSLGYSCASFSLGLPFFMAA